MSCHGLGLVLKTIIGKHFFFLEFWHSLLTWVFFSLFAVILYIQMAFILTSFIFLFLFFFYLLSLTGPVLVCAELREFMCKCCCHLLQEDLVKVARVLSGEGMSINVALGRKGLQLWVHP